MGIKIKKETVKVDYGFCEFCPRESHLKCTCPDKKGKGNNQENLSETAKRWAEIVKNK